MDKYNLDRLVRVVTNKSYESRRYEFRKEKRFFGRITRKEGFYQWLNDNYIGTEAPKNHFIKDGKLYEKPEVVLYFQDDNKKTYYFDTDEDAERFARDLTNYGKWIG